MRQSIRTGSALFIPGADELIYPRTNILKVLAYFDIFHYPLSKPEIRQFLDIVVEDIPFHAALDSLVEDKLVFQYQELYSLQDNPLLAPRRRMGNQRATSLLNKARSIGNFLYKFPFVRAVAVSGSLSKNYAEEKADIDFFIITSSKRLWLSRTLMHIFKKLTFLIGRQHYYCMNYYVDEEALLLKDQNVFSAIELRTLVPVAGSQVLNQFFSANDWSESLLPACSYKVLPALDRPAPLIKWISEYVLNKLNADFLDDYLFQATTRRWKRKESAGKKNEKGFMMGLVTGKHFARSNPGGFQEKVLSLYEEKLIKLGVA